MAHTWGPITIELWAERQECTVCGLAVDPTIGDGVNDARLPSCEEYRLSQGVTILCEPGPLPTEVVPFVFGKP